MRGSSDKKGTKRMERLVEALSIVISLITGLVVTEELYALLPSWSAEAWLWVTFDAGLLLLVFLQISWLAYYLLSDFCRWLLGKFGGIRGGCA